MTPAPTIHTGALAWAEVLAFSTSLITTNTVGGVATGTGFFFEYFRGHPSGKSLLVLATNRHVVEGSLGGSFRVTLADQDGLPDVGQHYEVPLPPPAARIRWIMHPDPSVDLAVLPVGPFLGIARSNGFAPYISTLTPENLPAETDLKLIAQLESVAMPGYPQGFWDQVNNQPIFRRGALATHPAMHYEGAQQFLVDIQCHPGSSGSPVVLCNPGDWYDKWGQRHEGGRFKLLGVLYAGYMQTAEGTVVQVPIPTSQPTLLAQVQVPIGLALCIDARRLMDFTTAFELPPAV